jgi:uncharacterized membrane protein
MKSQTALKILALIALVTSVAAIVIWRQTGEPPSPWIVRVAAASFGAAFVLFVVNEDTRPRIMLQFVAALFAIAALFAFVADVSAARAAAQGFHSTSLLDRMHEFAPTILMSVRATITRYLGASAWGPFASTLFAMPASVVFALAAAIFGFAGRPKRDVQIFVN